MKKRYTALLLAAVLILALLCGCGGSGNTASAAPMEPMPAPSSAPMAEAESYVEFSDAAMDFTAGTIESQDKGKGAAISGDKIIYSAYAEIETKDFEGTVQAVYDMVERHGGFIEYSAVSGNSYGRTAKKTATFELRVPKESFKEVTGSLEALGNVPYSHTNAENITSQYVDNESRLNSLRIQEERLLVMLEKAETVEDMLTIESRLSDVRYEIERITTTLQGWDSKINYSAVTLEIREVADYTQETPVQQTYWQSVGKALSGSLENVADFFKDLLKLIIAALPVILILIVAVIIALIPIRRARRRRLAKKNDRPENEDDQ